MRKLQIPSVAPLSVQFYVERQARVPVILFTFDILEQNWPPARETRGDTEMTGLSVEIRSKQ